MNRRTVLTSGGLVAGGALSSAFIPESARATTGRPAFQVMTPAATVAARTDRRPVAGGVHDPNVGRTFISWSGQYENGYVQAYDHRSRTWSGPLQVTEGEHDSHNYPTLIQARDGHLLIVVGMHNVGTVVARSALPHSIEGLWQVRTVAEGAAASYPMPFRARSGEIFVFFRETTKTIDPRVPSDTRPILYLRSRDHGRTWRSSAALTGAPYALGSTDRADNLNEIYIGQLRYDPGGRGRPERAHLVWTLAGGGPDQHLHDYFHKDIHYAAFDPRTLRFHGPGGRDLGVQLTDDEQEHACKVAVTPLARPAQLKSPDYIQLVGTTTSGRPFAVWSAADDTGLWHVFVSRRQAGRWRTSEVASGLRTREMEPVAGDVWRVYTTRDAEPGVSTYLLGPGRSWRPETQIATAKPVQRIELIAGFRDPARILITGASSARDVSIADGDIHVAGLTWR
ncbi:BNR-4 repeat-containing protein [Actinomadura rudentiformis]|uniref:Exo-alpha-sialidase n=1 Tax=Actinomadura rudentiformis TaxID=359158 RepID=A0A6H9YVH6_9ACTN|nr:BNR-4 repeat-containing protein [Actinomadura rudentiformis]KAB2352637.1 hypothetical protein F8566_03040 [Actinomadura rudentiformis]